MSGRMEVLESAARVSGDRVSEEELNRLADGVREINRNSADYWALRLQTEAERFQRWSGQSPDGKQRAEAMGTQPFPFDGASDQRVWWSDTLVNEDVQLMTVAALRANVRVLPKGMRGADDAWRAGKILKHFVARAGFAWWREHIRAANYVRSDSPAVAVLKLSWRRRRELEKRRLDAAELAGLYMELAGEGAEDRAEVARRFEEEMARGTGDGGQGTGDGGEGTDALADLIQSYFDVRRARALRAARELREEGRAEFPAPGALDEGLELRALRWGDDFYMLDGTSDFSQCQLWYEVRWMDRVAVLERVETEGWDREWAEEVLKHEGESCFDEYSVQGAVIEKTGSDMRTGYYQIVTAHYRALDEDGVPARYVCVFSTQVAEGRSAFGRRLDTDEAVFVSGEIIDQWLLNARGIPERVGPTAGIVKGCRDDTCDSARLQALPPITGDGYGTGTSETLPLEPLAYLPLKRGGKLQWLTGMQYPAHMVEVLKQLKDDRDEQFARPVDGVVPQRVSDTAAEFKTFVWIQTLRDLNAAAMRLIAREAADETLAEITDTDGRQAAPQGRGSLARGYDVEMTFDATTLDEERTIAKVQALTAVKQSDAENVLSMTPIVKSAVRALLPQEADEALRLGEEGREGEWESETRNYLSLRAGMSPELVADGTWNYALRLGFYERLLADNPAALDDLSPDKRDLVEQWVKALGFQAQQFGANREIGKTGVAEK